VNHLFAGRLKMQQWKTPARPSLLKTMYAYVSKYIATRKWGKAKRVARPACANLTAHVLLTYRLAMLLPSSEWPICTHHPCKLAKSQNISEVTGPKFSKFLQDVEVHRE